MLESAVFGIMGDALWDRVDVLADPCESNFAVTKFVAEPFNFLSAFGLILAGCNAMHQSRKYNFETRFMVLGFSVVVMGASSAFFHATLYQRAKSWEEMAIVWAAFGWICVLSQMNSPTNQTPCVAMVLSLGGGLWILQMGFDPQIILMGSRIFLNLYCAIGVYLLNDCVEKYCNLPLLLRRNKEYNFNPHPSMLKLQLMARWQVACAATAALVWILEVSFCGSLKNFQPHALYHLLIGLSCHYGLQFAMALRQSILHKAPPATSWSLGGLLGCVVPTEVPSRAMGAQLRWLLKIAGVDHLDNV